MSRYTLLSKYYNCTHLLKIKIQAENRLFFQIKSGRILNIFFHSTRACWIWHDSSQLISSAHSWNNCWIHLVCPLKCFITFDFNFSLVLQLSREKLRAMLVQNFGVQTRWTMSKGEMWENLYLLLERFSYDLQMKTREQNRNNKWMEIKRFDWFIERIQTRVAFGWLSERSRKKTSCPRTF